jgi:hypothetical protein
MVENTSDLVYKHAAVLVRERAAPAPANWTVPIGAPFYAIPYNCGSPSFVDPQNPWDLKPAEIGYIEGHFIRDDNVPDYTVYYLICSGLNGSGECTQGEFDFDYDNLQLVFFEALERVSCWLDPGPLAPEVDFLGEGMMARMLGRNMKATMGYFELNNGAMCWMDLNMLMFEPLEGTPEDMIFDPMTMPVINSLEAHVTFAGTVYCGDEPGILNYRAGIRVENTSDLVYKHINVVVKEGAAPAEDWSTPHGDYPFLTTPPVCAWNQFLNSENPTELNPTQIGYLDDKFSRDENIPYYTLYYMICSEPGGSGACTQGEFDFYNPQRIFFEALERVSCRLDPGPLAPEVDFLGEGMMARMLGRNMEATQGYFELNNGAMCWMDLEMLMFTPPEGFETNMFNLMGMPVQELQEDKLNGEHPPDPGAPMFDTSMFYYGGCTPQQVEVQMMVDEEDVFNVVMFYRLQDVESGEKTAWTGVSMNVFGNDYYKQVVHSSNIPDASMFKNAYFQVQFVVTNAEGGEILRTDVFPDMVMLSACGGPAPPPRPTPTPTPRRG